MSDIFGIFDRRLAVVGFALFSLMIGYFVLLIGHDAARSFAGAIDDVDCESWPPNIGPHDEVVENPHGCHEVCVDGHFWFELGHRTWCYYDDNATEALNA